MRKIGNRKNKVSESKVKDSANNRSQGQDHARLPGSDTAEKIELNPEMQPMVVRLI
jgi:hypothetical protein